MNFLKVKIILVVFVSIIFSGLVMASQSEIEKAQERVRQSNLCLKYLIALRDEKDPRATLDLIKGLCEDCPDRCDDHVVLSKATAKAELEEYEEAIIILNELAGRWNEYSVYYSRGRCYYNLKRFLEAAKDFERCYQMSGEKGLLSIVASMYDQADHMTKAITYYTEAINNGEDCYLSRAHAYLSLEKYEEALADIDKGKSICKKDCEEYDDLQPLVKELVNF